MLDKILVFIAMVALIIFCGVVVGFVAEPDLVITVCLVLALASHDFWISVFKKSEPSTLGPSGSLEARPTGVSGKPVDAPQPVPAKSKRPTKRKPAAKSSSKAASKKSTRTKTAAKSKSSARTASKSKAGKTATRRVTRKSSTSRSRTKK